MLQGFYMASVGFSGCWCWDCVFVQCTAARGSANGKGFAWEIHPYHVVGKPGWGFGVTVGVGLGLGLFEASRVLGRGVCSLVSNFRGLGMGWDATGLMTDESSALPRADWSLVK